MIRFATCTFVLALMAGCSGSSTPECAPGQFYDANMQMCVAGGGAPQCPPGQMWNGAQCAPGQAGGQCPPGQVFNGAGCAPQGGAAPQCPAGQSWNGSQCVPAAGPAPAQGGACTVQNIGGAGMAADQAIKLVAAQYIPAGSHAVGGALVGNFQPGQCMDTPIQVQAGKCYTVVGASVGTVTDLDVELIPNLPIPGLPSTAIAQDQTDGPTAVLGGKPNCWTAPIPGPMKLRIRVANGQGMAGAQLYAK